VSIVSVFGQVLSRFPVGSNPKTLALSGDGDTMYVLKGTASGTENVGVINVSLESQTKALPAPTGTTDIAVSSDGATLYAFVGTPSVGNVQLFSTG
jgi:DNA-binding beta-propeller fold protein YncE